MVQSLRRSKSFRILFNSPELVEEQRSGFHHFLKHGIAEELSKTAFLEVKKQNVDIEVFLDANTFQLIAPDENSRNCVIKMKTYACKLYVQIRVVWKKKSGEILMQTEPEWVLLAHLPMMTKRGHFVINGSPRVIVHQIVRAPGVYFQKFGKVKKDERNKARFYGDIIPRKGVWVRLQISKTGQVEIKLKKSTKVQAEMVERCLAVIEKQELSKRQTSSKREFAPQTEFLSTPEIVFGTRKFGPKSLNNENVFSTGSQFKRILDPPFGQVELLLPGSTVRSLLVRCSKRKVRRFSTKQTKLSSREAPKIAYPSLRKNQMATFSPFRGRTRATLELPTDLRKLPLRSSVNPLRGLRATLELPAHTSGDSLTIFRRNIFGLRSKRKDVGQLSNSVRYNVLQQKAESVSELSKEHQVQSLAWIRKAFRLLLGCFTDFAAPSCSATQREHERSSCYGFAGALENFVTLGHFACRASLCKQSGRNVVPVSACLPIHTFTPLRGRTTDLRKLPLRSSVNPLRGRTRATLELPTDLRSVPSRRSGYFAKQSGPLRGLSIAKVPNSTFRWDNLWQRKIKVRGVQVREEAKKATKSLLDYTSKLTDGKRHESHVHGVQSRTFVVRARTTNIERGRGPQTEATEFRTLRTPFGVQPSESKAVDTLKRTKIGGLPEWDATLNSRLPRRSKDGIYNDSATTSYEITTPVFDFNFPQFLAPFGGLRNVVPAYALLRKREAKVRSASQLLRRWSESKRNQNRKFGPTRLENRAPKYLSEKFAKAELKGDDRAFTNVYDNLYRVPEMKELEDKMYPKGSSIPIDTEFKRDFSYKHLFATFKAPWRYSLGTVGRHKLNKKFGLDLLENQLTSRDLQAARNWLVRLRDGKEIIDDIDHFQNRRVRQSGELLQNQFENGVTRLRKLVRRKLRTPTFEWPILSDLASKHPSVVELSRDSLMGPLLFSKAEQEAEHGFLSADKTCKAGSPETAGFVKLRRAVGASLAPYNRVDLLLGRAVQTRGTRKLQKAEQKGSNHRLLPVYSNSSIAGVRATQSIVSSGVKPSQREVRSSEALHQPELRKRMDGSLLTPFGVQQSEGVNEDFSGPSLANFSLPIKKSSLFSRANLWKIRESLCFYTRDKGKRIPLWELQINSRQTPFRYFIPRLLLTERHGLLSKAWARNRTHLKSNGGNHAVGQLFPTKGGLWTSPSLDYREPTRTILQKHEIFSILCTTERSVNKKSVPVAGFAFLKPTYSSLVLAGLNPLGGLSELRSSNFASRECGKCTKGQLLLVFSKAEQEVEYGSKRAITSRSNSVPTFDKLSRNESYRLLSEAEHAKVGKKGPRDQALNPTSGGARNSGATIRRVSIYDQIRCHLVRRLRKNVLVGPGLSLRQFELRLLHPWPELRSVSPRRGLKSERISKKGYILFCSTPITKSYTIHNQTAQKIEDFARLPIRASVHPKRFKKDATLELFGDSENKAKVVGPVVLPPFGGNPNYGAAKNPPLGVSKNESKPTRFAKAISLKRDSKHLGLPEESIARNFRRGLPTANQRPLWPRGGPVTQTKAVSLNRIFKQASELFSTKPINGALREFFGINPLSQYMDQTNPLAELTHKRRISSLGIGGVSRESAGMAIRGIHPTHYGRICPIETPEGKNAGLVNSLALYARLNKHGFIETPYYKVIKGQVQEELGFSFYSALKETVDRLHLAPSDLQQSQANMLGHLSLGSLLLRCSKLSEAEQASESALDRAVTKKQICQGPIASGRFMTTQTAASATGAIHYPKFRLPLKGVQLANEFGEASAGSLVPVRVADTLLDVFKKVTPYEVDCIGISPVQILSVATSLIPFLEHNDANRALMGSNMQRQAVPLMISERPIVGTGLETLIAAESGQVIQSSISGLVSHVSANKIIIERLFNTGPKDGLDQPSTIFLRTFPNRPRSKKMDGSLLLTQVEHGILADTSGTKDVSCSAKLSMQRRANTSRTKEFLAPYGGNLSEVPATEPLTFATQKWERAELLANFRYAQGCPRRGDTFASLLLTFAKQKCACSASLSTRSFASKRAVTTFRLPPKGAKKDVVLSEAERARKSCPNIFLKRRPFAKAKLSFAETKAIKLSYLITSRRNDSLLCLQWTTPQIWLYSILSTCAIKPSTDWTTRSTSNRAYPIWQSLASFRALIARRSMSKNVPSTVSRRRLPHEFITPFLLTRRVSKKKVERSESFRFSEIDFVKASRALSALRSVLDSPTSKLQTVTFLAPSVTLTPRTLAGLPFACRASLSYIHLRKNKQKVKFANRNFVSGFRYALLTFAKQKCACSASLSTRSFASKREAKAWRSASRQFSPAFTGPYVVCQEPEGRFFSRADLLLTNFRLRFAEQSIAHGVPLEPLWFAKQTLECAHPFAPAGRTTDLRKLPIRTSVYFAKQSVRKYVPGRATLELSKLSFGRARINHKSVSSAGYRSLCAQTLLRKSTWFCVSKYKKPKNHVLFSELSQLYKNKVQQSQHKLSVFGLLSAPDPVLLNLRLSVGLNPLCGCTEVRSGNLAERKLLRSEGFGAKLLLEWLTRSELAIKRPSVVESTTPKGLIIKRQPKVAVESPDNRARSIGKRAPRSRFAETSQQMTLFPFVHSLRSFSRSNQETCLTQKPLIQEGEWVQKGDVLTDCSASEKGELAVGKNVMIAYLPWEGYNFEDAIVVSDRLTKEQIYASLHIERYVCEAQDIKEKITNSNEWFTRNLPGVNPKLVSHLDTFGFPKIGTILNEGDILVGKMRYFRNKPTTPYEKLLSDILGDGHFSVSLTSLRVPKGVHEARVISHRVVKTFRSSLENTFTGVSRPAGTPKMVNIFLGEKRSIQIGDKMSGRHGNKGIISTILPKQDMPYLPDGSPIDILLNPLGVPSRMNVGQIFESLLGLASTYLNQNFKITAFDELYGVEASQSLVYLKLYQARLQSGQNWLFQINFPGKTRLIDGRSGECFDQWVTVGRAYMLKLIHMVNEKIHARNTGPYALITQQPLRGRSQKGGQRLGEMEVWALEGYGAAYILQELLTKKSDDFAGRQEIINSLVVRSDKFSSPENPYREYSNPDDPYQRFSDPDNPYQVIQETRLVLGHPEIFKTLICELQALCLDVGVYALKKDSFQREYLGIVN